MCVQIEAKAVLMNLLHFHSHGIGYKEINSFKEKVMQAVLNGYLFIDTSSNSIQCAILNNPDLFTYSFNKIERAKDANNFFTKKFIDDYVNYSYPKAIKTAVFKSARSGNGGRAK